MPQEVQNIQDEFMHHTRDVFAWLQEEIPFIYAKNIVYRLNIDPNVKLIRQKRRSYNQEKYEGTK